MNKEFKHESAQSLDAVISHLECFRDGLKEKSIRFSNQKDEIVAEPSGLMTLILKGKTKDNKNNLSLSIEWKQ